jgi:hypothetical protein
MRVSGFAIAEILTHPMKISSFSIDSVVAKAKGFEKAVEGSLVSGR